MIRSKPWAAVPSETERFFISVDKSGTALFAMRVKCLPQPFLFQLVFLLDFGEHMGVVEHVQEFVERGEAVDKKAHGALHGDGAQPAEDRFFCEFKRFRVVDGVFVGEAFPDVPVLDHLQIPVRHAGVVGAEAFRRDVVRKLLKAFRDLIFSLCHQLLVQLRAGQGRIVEERRQAEGQFVDHPRGVAELLLRLPRESDDERADGGIADVVQHLDRRFDFVVVNVFVDPPLHSPRAALNTEEDPAAARVIHRPVVLFVQHADSCVYAPVQGQLLFLDEPAEFLHVGTFRAPQFVGKIDAVQTVILHQIPDLFHDRLIRALPVGAFVKNDVLAEGAVPRAALGGIEIHHLFVAEVILHVFAHVDKRPVQIRQGRQIGEGSARVADDFSVFFVSDAEYVVEALSGGDPVQQFLPGLFPFAEGNDIDVIVRNDQVHLHGGQLAAPNHRQPPGFHLL